MQLEPGNSFNAIEVEIELWRAFKYTDQFNE